MLATSVNVSPRITCFLVTVTALLCSAVLAEPDHVIFDILRGGTQCFTITAPANDKLTGEVRVANGKGEMAIGFWVLVGPTNEMLHSKSNVEHEKFSVVAPRGPHHGHDNESTPSEYKLCVFHRGSLRGGAASDIRRVVVSFDASANPNSFDEFGGTTTVLKGIALQSDVNEIRSVLSKVERTLSGITDEIDAIRGREQALFETSSRVAQQIWVMGAVSCLAIAVAGVFQLYRTDGELKLHGSKVLEDGHRGVLRDRSKGVSRQGSVLLRKSLDSVGRLASFAEDRRDSLPSHAKLSRKTSLKKVQSEKNMSRSRSLA